MPRSVASDVFRIEISVPFKLGHVNVYLIDTGDGFILVDTGVATAEALDQLKDGLNQLGIAFGDLVSVVITHFHADHAGQAGRIQQLSGASVRMGASDAAYIAEFLDTGPPVEPLGFLRAHGVPDVLVGQFGQVLPALGRLIVPFSVDGTVATGDPIGSGRKVLGLQTPGHTPGHLCLFLPDEGLLFAGDHILPHITPNIGLYAGAGPNPLASYISSLQVVLGIAPRRILPAHGPVIEDPAGRIKQLLDHHQRRLDQIKSTISTSGVTAWKVTEAVFGEGLDPIETWMAFFESLAHLEYLVSVAELHRFRTEARMIYQFT